jgi:NhaP-type Na+/H+ or K+/H+ antiporter
MLHHRPQIISEFCLLAIVGMLLGAAFGVATSWLLENIFRRVALQCVWFSIDRLLHNWVFTQVLRWMRLPQTHALCAAATLAARSLR